MNRVSIHYRCGWGAVLARQMVGIFQSTISHKNRGEEFLTS